MNINYVRSSSINSYKDCQWRYALEYVIGLKNPAGKKAYLGTIIHHVLELFAKAQRTNHYKLYDSYTDPDYLLDICWARYSGEEGHSFNLTKADFKFCQNSIQKVLCSDYNPLKLKVRDIEKQFCIPIIKSGFEYQYYDFLKDKMENGYFEMRGTIDLIVERDDDCIEIVDWKTGKRKCWVTGEEKDYEYFTKKDLQLKIYDLVASILYPEKHRLVTIYFVNDGGPFTVSFSDEDRENTYQILRQHFKEVSVNNLPTRIKEERPHQQWKCNRVCHFGKTVDEHGRSLCDRIYNHMVHRSLDLTILEIDKLKKKKRKQEVQRTSNRRNVF